MVFTINGYAEINEMPGLSHAVPSNPGSNDENHNIGNKLEGFLKKQLSAENALTQDPAANISFTFKNTPLADVVSALSRQANINIIMDKDVDTKITVTSVYTGTSVEEILKRITTSMDLVYRKNGDGYIITPWMESYIDVNKVYEFGGGPSGGGGSSGGVVTTGTAATPSVNNSSQNKYDGGTPVMTDFGGYMNSLLNIVRPMLSRHGVISYMPTGFLYVHDYPSKVKAIEELFSIDNSKRDEINLKITIVRIDYNKEHESGINWSKVFEGFKLGNGSQLEIGANFLASLSGQTDNVFNLGYKNPNSNLSVVLKALQKYGSTKLIHSWQTRAMTGSVLPFKLTQSAWYSTGDIIQVVNNQTITSPQIASTDVGLEILLNPIKYNNRYLVNTSVKMSSIVGQQSIGKLTLPNIENNLVTVPIKMAKGEQVIVSGFKIRSTDKNSAGIPLISRLPILEYLFGYKTSQDRTSEMAVIITIDQDDDQDSEVSL